jgi:hypothetical protein
MCGQHSDCGELEVCVFGVSAGNDLQCTCAPTCRTDVDCGEDQACFLSPYADRSFPERSHARCIPAQCRTSADCENGRCILSLVNEACSTSAKLACMDDSSACFVDSDCPKSDYGCNVSRPINGYCQPESSKPGSWTCRPSQTACRGWDCN